MRGKSTITIAHELPHRIRLFVPNIAEYPELQAVKKLINSIHGIESVRMQPLIHTVVINYDSDKIRRKDLLQNLFFIFQRNQVNSLSDFVTGMNPIVRRDLLRSAVSGFLLLMTFSRRRSVRRPDVLDYSAVISTAYTVINHGTNKLRHPDIITGIVSMLSLGASNIIQVSFATWVVNLLEIISDMKRSTNASFHINHNRTMR